MNKKPTKINLTSDDSLFEKSLNLQKFIEDLSSQAVNLSDKFSFTWAGKSNAIKSVLVPSKLTLNPEPKQSIKWDESENLFIEGDNLEVLKLLQKAYFEKVKMIYIDPPYNTGHDFVYNDNFSAPLDNYLKQTRQKTEAGESATTNKETNGRYHSDWLSMMYPRLKLAWNLLREDGVIFVSIDDNEAHHLRMIMDEIFGEENFISNISWHNNVKGRQMDLHIKNTYESIIVFAKDANKVTFNTYKEKVDTSELENDGISFYEKDYPLHNGTSEFHINNRPNLAYSIYYSPETGDAKTIDEKITKDGKFEIGGPTKEGEILIKDGYVRILPKYNTTYRNQRVWRWGQEKFLNEYKTELLFCLEENGYYIYQKKRYENGIAETKYKNYINIDGGIAKKELFQILDLKVFENPKPLSLIQHLLNIGTGKDDLVMDFFAGSGTTAHAVLKLNSEDGGKRRFVLVQLPEATSAQSEARKNGYKFITEITAERIRRVIKGYGENPQPINAGFKVFTLSQSNYPENTFEFNSEKSPEENQKAFVDYLNKAKQSQLFDKENDISIVYENIVKEGLSLNSKVEKVSIGKNNTYRVTDGEQQLLICLENKLATETVKELTDKYHKDKLFICLESALDDTTAANLSLNLDLKTI